MKSIALRGGKYALLDDEDFDKLKQYKWHLNVHGYCFRFVWIDGRRVSILMHREILGLKVGEMVMVDHVNSNRCDNRKENIRVCSRSQNAGNQRLSSNNTSGIKGVSWDKKSKKWRASIRFGNKNYHLGFFANKEDAGKAYEKEAVKRHGEFANFGDGCVVLRGVDVSS